MYFLIESEYKVNRQIGRFQGLRMSMDFNSKQPPEYNEIYGKRVRTSHCVAFVVVVCTLLIVSTYFVMNMED